MAQRKTQKVVDHEELALLRNMFLARQAWAWTIPRDQQIIGVIGNIGSGKTTFARLMAEHVPGLVHVQANSARYLLKTRDLPWGDNVHAVISKVISQMVRNGCSVILDGSTVQSKDRDRLGALACELAVAVRFIRINTDPFECSQRTALRYNDPMWESSFGEFRVNTTEKMLENIRARAPLHEALRDEEIENLFATVDNNAAPDFLAGQAYAHAWRLKQGQTQS